jgi:hypothetical protein
MFRFTTRDLIWLIFVAALACAWWLDRVKTARENRELTLQFVNLTNEMKTERDQLRKEVAGLHAELAEEAHQYWRTTRNFLLADRAAWQEERNSLLARIRELETTTRVAPGGP